MEEVGIEPLEKKRREARAWLLRAASWKEFMVVYLVYLSLDLRCVGSGTKDTGSVQKKDFFDGQSSSCTISDVDMLRVSPKQLAQRRKRTRTYIGKVTLCKVWYSLLLCMVPLSLYVCR